MLWWVLFLCQTAGAAQIPLAWTKNPDPVVAGYKLYYGTSSGSYTNSVDVGNAASYTLSNLPDGVTYYIAATAYDAAKKESIKSNEVSLVAAPIASFSASLASGSIQAGQAVTFTDTSAGSVATRSWNFGNGTTSTGQIASTNYATAGTYSVTLTVTGTGGNSTSTKPFVVVAPPPAVPVANFTATPTTGVAPLATTFTNTSTGTVSSWLWTFGDAGTSTAASPTHTYTAAGTYTVTLTATNASGSSTKSGRITVTSGGGTSGGGASSGGPVGTSANGLVAAYGFEDLAGATVVDASGLGNHGTATNARRTNSGRFGRALSFNGKSSWVTINDSASLKLTGAVTMEAWVNPAATLNGLSSVLAKETTTGSVYGLLANSDTNRPAARVMTTTWGDLPGGTSLRANVWTHLAVTYDSATTTLTLYINAKPVAQSVMTGNIQFSNGALRIGAHSLLGQYFNGRIDEVRLYNRALSQTQIASDSATPVVTSLWNAAVAPINTAKPDSNAVELGIRFKSDVAGYITGLRFYKSSLNTGTHVGNLWSSTGTLLARATFTNETTSGWQQVNFAKPVAITANTVYVASYHTDTGYYSIDENYFTVARARSPMQALANGGVYNYGSDSIFPVNTWYSSNYWVDVLFRR